MKDYYSPETDTKHQSMAESHDVSKEQIKADLLDTVRIDCPKCDGKRVYETNRVSIKKKDLSPEAFITRYKCVKCGYSWIVYDNSRS